MSILTMDSLRLTNDRTSTFTKKKTSGHEPQLGLDTKTDRLTVRQLQHDFDFDFELVEEIPEAHRTMGCSVTENTSTFPSFSVGIFPTDLGDVSDEYDERLYQDTR
jgi:hypothetical protein